MGQVIEYIFEDLAAIKQQQSKQRRFNRRVVIFSLLAILVADVYTYRIQNKCDQLSDELKEYKQSKGE